MNKEVLQLILDEIEICRDYAEQTDDVLFKWLTKIADNLKKEIER